MAPRENDDEMELINSEFESMVADLNLDQAAPTTYLDELDAIESQERADLYIPPRSKKNLHQRTRSFIETAKRWWNRSGDDNSDGAIV